MTFEHSGKHLLENADGAEAADGEPLLAELFATESYGARSAEFYAGLEAAAVIADHAGIKDVNIDCPSGARIAQKIRTIAKTSQQSENAKMDVLMSLKATRDLAFCARYDSTQGWTAYVAAKTAYEEAATTYLDTVFDHY